MRNNILIVVAHPDDEVLGAGGTILKHVHHGDQVNILIMGDGESSRDKQGDIHRRARQARSVAQIVGAKKIILESLPDNQFDSVPVLKITKIIEKHLFEIKPNIIYTHFANDLNVDHRLTFQSVLTSCRPLPDFFVKKILSFEILSSTEWQQKTGTTSFAPTEYINISEFIEKKLKMMRIYKDELHHFPHPRSLTGIKTLALFRGMEVGFKYAEAFQVVRLLDD